MKNIKTNLLQVKTFVRKEASKSSTMAEIIPLVAHHSETEYMKLKAKEIIKSSLFVVGTLALMRLFPMLPNFTPILALALFMPSLTKNKSLQYGLPVSIMFITDLFLGLYSTMPFVYGAFLLATYISNNKNLLEATAYSWLAWHVIVNTPMALTGHGFAPFTPEALLFDVRLLASTVLYLGVFKTAETLWQTAYQKVLQRQ